MGKGLITILPLVPTLCVVTHTDVGVVCIPTQSMGTSEAIHNLVPTLCVVTHT
ncbi:MAG: hypothetical protein ACI909_001244, partial [Planctomycetota bacterium]